MALLERVLDELAVPAVLLRGRRIVLANASAREILERGGATSDALAAALADEHAAYQRTRILLEDGDSCTLVVGRTPGWTDAIAAAARRTHLSPRQLQVAELLARGARNREIAATLGCSEHTIERHVSAVLRRLGCGSRAEVPARLHAEVQR